jgi:hypothetical protein
MENSEPDRKILSRRIWEGCNAKKIAIKFFPAMTIAPSEDFKIEDGQFALLEEAGATGGEWRRTVTETQLAEGVSA